MELIRIDLNVIICPAIWGCFGSTADSCHEKRLFNDYSMRRPDTEVAGSTRISIFLSVIF